MAKSTQPNLTLEKETAIITQKMGYICMHNTHIYLPFENQLFSLSSCHFDMIFMDAIRNYST